MSLADIVSLTEALIRDMRRFQRAAGGADKLHVPRDGKCAECRKPWPCPTKEALSSGLDWDGHGDPWTVPPEIEAALQAHRDKAHTDGPCNCFTT